MTYKESVEQMNELRRNILDIRKKIRGIQAGIEPEEVEDYELSGPDGSIRLSQLFGDHDTLILIHNMGAGCLYCTLWADGFNGAHEHLGNRAAFVVSSPDAPESQKEFAASRGWGFRMVSHQGTSFAEDMGYTGEHGFEPGVSVFRKDGNRVLRVSDTSLGPGDDFCSVWHFFDMIPEGPNGWAPKYRYS